MKKTLCLITAPLLLAGGANAATVIIGGATANGNFETTTGDDGSANEVSEYAETTNWVNIGGAETVNFSRTDLSNGGSGSRNGFHGGGRHHANTVGYTVVAAGEVFSVGLSGIGDLRWDDEDIFRVTLFTTATNTVTDATVNGDKTVLATIDFTTTARTTGQGGTGVYEDFSNSLAYTTVGADVGKTVFYAVQSVADSTERARIDDAVFEVTTVPEPSSTALLGLSGLALILRRRK